MNDVLITVIIPFFNTAEKIERCIKSVITQTYKNLEILMVNDGSTDNSLEICEIFAKNDNRIKIISINNQGVSVARNCGIEQSNGEYVMFVDSDDYVENTIVEKLYYNIVETNSDVSQCGCSVTDDNGNIFKFYNVPYLDTINEDKIISKIVLPLFGKDDNDSATIQGFCVCKLFKKSILKNIRFNEEQRKYQDRCFNIDVYLAVEKASFVNESLYYYVINPDSSTQRRRDDLWKQCETLIKILYSKIDCFPSKFKEELMQRIHKTASTRLVFVTRHIFRTKEKVGFLNAIKSVKKMRENLFFDDGVTNPNLGFVFSILSKLLHYRLYFLAVLIAKIAR